MLRNVRAYYPNAISSDDFIAYTYKVLCEQYGIKPHNILLANSICSDDVNAIEYPEAGRQMLGPFNLGGLNGYPFGGLTGMGAFSGHVPDEGAAMVFFGPHIGIGREGVPGKIWRVGQHEPSACCGAVLKAMANYDAGTMHAGIKDDIDFQQQTLEDILTASLERLENANDRLLAATDIIYEASEKRIDELLSRTKFRGKHVFVIGAVIINSDHEAGSFLEIRRFDCLDVETKAVISTHTFDAALAKT